MLTTKAEIESVFKDPMLEGMDKLDAIIVEACVMTALGIGRKSRDMSVETLNYMIEKFSIHRQPNPIVRKLVGDIVDIHTDMSYLQELRAEHGAGVVENSPHTPWLNDLLCTKLIIKDYVMVKTMIYKLVHRILNTPGSFRFSKHSKYADERARRDYGLYHLTPEQIDGIRFKIAPTMVRVCPITHNGTIIHLESPISGQEPPEGALYRLAHVTLDIEIKAITHPEITAETPNPSGVLLNYSHRIVQPELKPEVSYIGFELEMTRPRYAGENNATKVAEIANALGFKGEYITKRDGSIGDSGVEFVTQALTIDKYRGRYSKYLALFNQLRKAGFISHDAKNCGLHFHISKAPIVQLVKEMYRDTPENAERISNRGGDRYHAVMADLIIADSFKKLKQDLIKISRRQNKSGGQYAQWHTNLARYRETRYSAINCSSEATYEIRIFRGTLNFNSFMIATEFAIIFNEVLMQALLNLQGTWDLSNADTITEARSITSKFFYYSSNTFRYRVMTNLMARLEKHSPASAVRLAMLLNPYAKVPVNEDNYKVAVLQVA
jgi:hypothetical protein